MPKHQKNKLTLEGLNPEQKKAVEHENGPLLIIAGAGTGKTHVITRKVAWLISEKGIKPDEILALTFTNKAALEMEERVDKILPYGYVELWISTFHNFCQRVLSAHAMDIGISNNVELLDETGQWLLIRENLKKFDLDYYKPANNPTKFIKSLISHFSKLKDEEISPIDYLKYAESLNLKNDNAESLGGKTKLKKIHDSFGEESEKLDSHRIFEVANAYHVYQELLLENNKMDFGDLINYTLKIFRKRPGVLAKYQKQFKHVLVDEFQDTNWAQYDLLKMVALPQNNITVVADDDQSIYRFRGASMSNVMAFYKDFPEASAVSLVRNYRSGQEILDSSYSFIQFNNPNRLEEKYKQVSLKKQNSNFIINKKLISETNEISTISHLHAKNGLQEARIVAETILELKNKDKDSTWNDFAILVRANSQAEFFEEALLSSKIPRQSFSSAGLFRITFIANIISFFELLDDYHESRAVFRLLLLPFISIPLESIIKLTHYSNKKRVPLFSVIKEPERAGIFDQNIIQSIKKILLWVEEYGQMSKTEKPSTLLFDWLSNKGYLEYLNSIDESERLNHYRVLRHFWEHLKEIEKSIPDARVKDVVGVIKDEILSGNEGSLPQDEDAGPEMVKVMTVHSAKGLEFKYVFVTNLVDRRFPTTERKDPIQIPDDMVKEVLPEGDLHLEEERRLFYVAMTRAKKGLFLTSAENYGGSQKKKFSRFLTELESRSENFKISKNPLGSSPCDFLPKTLKEKKKDFYFPIPKKFSFTQLQVFNEDPFEYKLFFIYKIPLPGKYVFSYGGTIHSSLYRFFQLLSEKTRSENFQANLFPSSEASLKSDSSKNSLGSKIKVSLDELLKIYDDCWIEDWYESAEQKEKYYKQGKSRMKNFYENLKSKGVPSVKALERSFNLKIGEYTIVGRMDRVDQMPDGSVRIIDYKTGSPKTKLTTGDKLQLLIYQIAAEEVFGEKVFELVYLYFDAENIKNKENEISFIGSKQDKEKTKEWVLDTIEKIEKSDFAPAKERRFKSEDVEYLKDLSESGSI